MKNALTASKALASAFDQRHSDSLNRLPTICLHALSMTPDPTAGVVHIWHETFSSAGHTLTLPQLCRGRTASAGLRSPEPGWRSQAPPFRPAGDPIARSVACVRLTVSPPVRRPNVRGCTPPAVADRQFRRFGWAYQAAASKPRDGWHSWRPAARRQSSFRPLLGTERSKGKRRHPFHGTGRAAKGRSCGFFGEVRFVLSLAV